MVRVHCYYYSFDITEKELSKYEITVNNVKKPLTVQMLNSHRVQRPRENCFWLFMYTLLFFYTCSFLLWVLHNGNFPW